MKNERLLLSIPTLLGTEAIVANEVRKLGYDTTEVIDGRVTFEGDFEAICLANINLRCAERVMIKVAEFRATTFDMLFKGVASVEWERYIERDAAFPVKGFSLKSQLHSVPDCQKIIKKAIASRLSSKYGIQWFDETGAMYPIQFGLMKDTVTLYIDTSGVSLYKRGYRQKGVVAPMRETLAYAVLDVARWRGDRVFFDPFCGSGTLPIEAALYASNIAPGINRHFVSETWVNHIGAGAWKDARDEARENENKNCDVHIYASDINADAIKTARANAARAHVADKIHFSVCDVKDLKPFNGNGIIVCNPPYGERLMDAESCEKLYAVMRKKFNEFAHTKKYIFTSHEKFESIYGKCDKRRKLYNGMLKCYIYQYFKDI